MTWIEERPRLPKAVVDTLDHIRRILFPGYYAENVSRWPVVAITYVRGYVV